MSRWGRRTLSIVIRGRCSKQHSTITYLIISVLWILKGILELKVTVNPPCSHQQWWLAGLCRMRTPAHWSPTVATQDHDCLWSGPAMLHSQCMCTWSFGSLSHVASARMSFAPPLLSRKWSTPSWKKLFFIFYLNFNYKQCYWVFDN